MDWLNYHHLRYFWTVVREGGISKAADKLQLLQPTISAQVKRLEDALGERLFQRKDRTLVLTDVGRVMDRYAREIFTRGSWPSRARRGRTCSADWKKGSKLKSRSGTLRAPRLKLAGRELHAHAVDGL